MKAVIYARYSKGPRQTEQSIEGQVRDCQEYAKKHGLDIIHIYADHHISGKSSENRAELQRMLRDAEKKQFDFVICWKVDRLGRNREELVLNKLKLKHCGVRVAYAEETIPEGPEGIILESLMEGLAEYYSADLRQKILRGKRESAMKGYAVTGVAPLGYKIVDRKYEIDQDEAPIVQEIFRRVLDGETFASIIADLTARGIRTHSGTPLSPNGISGILRNAKYHGECSYHGIEIPCPQIIDDETWAAMQAKIKNSNPHRVAGSKRATSEFLLALKGYCKCGAPLVAETGTSHTGKKYCYYKCSARKKDRNACDAPPLRKEALEQLIAQHTMTDVLVQERMVYIADRMVDIRAKEIADDTERTRVKKALAKNKKKAQNLVRAIENGLMCDDMQERFAALSQERADLEARLSLASIQRPPLTFTQVMYWLQQFSDGDLADDSFRKHLLSTFVSRVDIGKDEILVTYNMSENHGSHVSLKMKHAGFEPATP